MQNLTDAEVPSILWYFVSTLPRKWQKSKNLGLNSEYFCHESLQYFEDVRGTQVTFTIGEKRKGLQERELDYL